MAIREIQDNVVFFGGAFFSFYVVGRERAALIELGISQTAPVVARVLRDELGITPAWLVAPHSHYDHSGGATRLMRAFPDAGLVAGQAAADILADGANRLIHAAAMEKVNGNPLFERAFPDADTVVECGAVETTRVLRGGDTIETDAGALEIIETPGHSPCSLSLFHRESGALFVSDACGMPLPSGRIWPTAFDDVKQYIASLHAMLRLEPEAVCPGHFPFFSNGRASRFIEKTLAATENFFERVHRLVEQFGPDEPKVLEQLRNEYDEDVTFIQDNILRYGNRAMARQVIEQYDEYESK